MRLLKESERFISVRAAAAQNPPQTFRVRERSKSGYASRLLGTVPALPVRVRARASGVLRGTP